MTDTQKSTRVAVVELRQQINGMSSNIRSFATSIRSLYINDIMADTAAGKKLRKLRDDTRNDAMLCLNDVLPLSIIFVESIRDYFDYYEELEFEKWCQMIPQILAKTIGYRQFSERLVQMYQDTLVPVKRRQDQASVVETELRELKEDFERKERDLENTARAKRALAIRLAFIPGVNLIASPILASSAHSDLQEAAKNSVQAAIQEATATKVSETLIPALQDFVSGIAKAARFFSVMEQELRKFEGRAEKGNDTRKKLHYWMMKTEARDMKSICRIFNAALPEVRNDLSTCHP